ncbi:hypothetical protein K7432_008809 [Basidiobolus ranarum]|uniref:Uncharacterized protein n=1 Tax=Basidiobolus ranarum TaxID=34480 RepID=A0ABR2VYW9_9FUNG
MISSSVRRISKRLSFKPTDPLPNNDCGFCHGDHVSSECAEAVSELERYVVHNSSHMLQDQRVDFSESWELNMDLARIRTSIYRLSCRRLVNQVYT